ncbi:MAG TPA: methylated-DNA--[protein]-cysteine S-methyltransferase [Candidatus Acidoferrum sp.]|nr:methylated-DNA--[protein]-cysteine S-methyltransferase [Candidatus Acidoferrum sp.]
MSEPSFLKMHSPAGELTVFAADGAVVGISFEQPESLRRMLRYVRRYYGEPVMAENPVLLQAESEICEYFDKKRRGFTVPIAYKGTVFQHKVWETLHAVPFGEILTYGELARRSGAPDAPRAAGAACGANPIALIIPCHRAVGADGSLTKFGGGLDAKCTLLQLEGHAVDVRQRIL